MTTDALERLRADLVAGIAARRRRARRRRRRAAAAVLAAGAAAALYVPAWGPGDDHAALAITRDARWLEVRIVDDRAGRDEIVRELREAGIDAEVSLSPTSESGVGRFLGLEVEPRNVHAPSPEARAEVQLVRLHEGRLRVRTDFGGRVYLIVGRAGEE